MMRPTRVWRVRAKPDAKARKLSDTSRDYNLRSFIQRYLVQFFWTDATAERKFQQCRVMVRAARALAAG